MDMRHTLTEGDATHLDIDGLRLAYRDAGDGPTVLCLHAVGHGSRDFAALRARVGASVRLVTLDWPGHGSSADDPATASAPRYAEILARVVEALALDRPVILGNSIGGAAAIRYAAAHPDRVGALIVSDAGGLLPIDRTVRAFCGAMAAAYRRGTLGARWFPLFYAAQYQVLLRGRAAREHRRRIVAAGRAMAPVLEQAWRSFAREEADIRALVPEVRCPVLLAWARSDPYNAYRGAKAALDGFRDARTVLFAGGHAPFIEAPDGFARTLIEFVHSLPTAEASPGRASVG